MIVIMVFLLTINIALSYAIYYITNKCLELQDKLENTTIQIEESLDMIDTSYQRISKILQLNVNFDDPVVRQLLQDIKYSKDALLLIANKIGIQEPEEKFYDKN